VRALVYLMGPSGAGKDSLLRQARAVLTEGDMIAFAHRYITRPPDPQHENYVALTDVEFRTRRDKGLFSYDWRAHGVRYAVGKEVETWRRAGFLVVVSGSREHFKSLTPAPKTLFPVLITAPPEAIARRLAQRGREDPAAQAARRERNAALTIEDPAVATIDNSGTIEDAGERFLALLRRLAEHREGTMVRD
jgi:ribose 1,5-bisphosphokinase